MKKLFKQLLGFALVTVTVFLAAACPMYNDIDSKGIPKFVSVNYIDLSQTDGAGKPLINKISRFRSSEGHDYSDRFENNRSMKHYFATPNSQTKIYAPVSGTITQCTKETYENSGYQLHIASDSYPAFKFIIFHMEPIKDFIFGEKVTAGQVLGNHTRNEYTFSSDIAVKVYTLKGDRLVSYFETLTPEALKPYTDRYAISNPGRDFLEDVIISKAERDAHPLHLKGKDAFADAESDPLEQDVFLDEAWGTPPLIRF